MIFLSKNQVKKKERKLFASTSTQFVWIKIELKSSMFSKRNEGVHYYENESSR